nr:type III secretion protein HrpB4 [Burkholderia sp. FERM BP-3421]
MLAVAAAHARSRRAGARWLRRAGRPARRAADRRRAAPAAPARALLARHTELRHWIDRASRARLAAWVGADAARALATLPDAPRARADAAPPLAGQSDDTLAWEGWCRFERERAWSPAGPTRAVRFALPRDAACPPWLADAAPNGDGAALLARLLAQHPEWSWLSG